MGTPEFAVLSLARLIADGHHVAAVFTQPDKPAGRGNKLQSPPVKRLAVEHGLAVHQPAKIKNNDEVRETFIQTAPDACIVAAYGRILPEWLLKIPEYGCVNVHASLLPKYRGAAPINWAIANGERQTGVTIMLMDAGMDTGPMLAQHALEIGATQTAPELSEQLAILGAELLSETLPGFERGEIRPIPQDNSQATYAPMLRREHGLIDWRLTGRQISDRIRAFIPWPGTYTLFRGQRLIFWNGEIADLTQNSALLSTVLEISGPGITLACGGGTALRVLEVQIEGKRRISAREFANGMRLKIGDLISDEQLQN